MSAYKGLHFIFSGGGGTDLEKGVLGCGALMTPFSRLIRSLQGSHFKQNSLNVSSQDLFWEKLWKF